MKKTYRKPAISTGLEKVGFPTVLAIGAVSAAVGAASVAVGKMIGNIAPQDNNIDQLAYSYRLEVKGAYND